MKRVRSKKILTTRTVFLVASFCIVGLVLLRISSAAQLNIAVEPENSTVFSPAQKLDNQADASNKSYIKFTQGQSSWWKPSQNTRWNWVLQGGVTTSNATEMARYDMYDIDMQDAMPTATSQEVTWPSGYKKSYTWPAGQNAGVIGRLKAKGKKVICYIDTGAFENYRPDASAFPGSSTKGGGTYTGDPSLANQVVIGGQSKDSGGQNFVGEFWLDQRIAAVQNVWGPIIWARMDLAKAIGCDGLEGDQNNAYGNDTTFVTNLAESTANSLRLYREVFYQLHKRGLTALIKNGVELTDAQTTNPSDISYCTPGLCVGDGYLVEECGIYTTGGAGNPTECSYFDKVSSKGIWVGEAEYKDETGYDIAPTPTNICPAAKAAGRMALIKPSIQNVTEINSTLCWEPY